MTGAPLANLLTTIPEWFKHIFTRHYAPREMVWIAIVGFIIGLGYGWWAKRRLKQQQKSGKR